ncbi:hypothetical protein H4CHR_02728 [Variovorax sp. PBS-H4]|nr:hypothetical protein H4CHR_02728 [Variovorax sp. PBS-H4]
MAVIVGAKFDELAFVFCRDKEFVLVAAFSLFMGFVDPSDTVPIDAHETVIRQQQSD